MNNRKVMMKNKTLYIDMDGVLAEYLENELLEMENGNREFISLEDMDEHIEQTIRNYES